MDTLGPVPNVLVGIDHRTRNVGLESVAVKPSLCKSRGGFFYDLFSHKFLQTRTDFCTHIQIFCTKKTRAPKGPCTIHSKMVVIVN